MCRRLDGGSYRIRRVVVPAEKNYSYYIENYKGCIILKSRPYPYNSRNSQGAKGEKVIGCVLCWCLFGLSKNSFPDQKHFKIQNYISGFKPNSFFLSSRSSARRKHSICWASIPLLSFNPFVRVWKSTVLVCVAVKIVYFLNFF